jgi:hypothetical protein
MEQHNTVLVVHRPLSDNMKRPGTYTGSLNHRTEKPYGQGRMEYDDMIYEGQWIDGDWSGFGRIIATDGSSSYQGGFLDNRKHGLGVLKYPDGRVYDGAFQLDRMGKGTMQYTDGSTYWGYYVDNIPHGRGKFTIPDGTIYDGEMDRGSFEGHGRMTFPDGRWYLGEWTDGQKNGIGLEVLADGSLLHEGTFCNGHPVHCSSFPQRRKSTISHLLYRVETRGRTTKTLVGPLPRHLSMKDTRHLAMKDIFPIGWLH